MSGLSGFLFSASSSQGRGSLSTFGTFFPEKGAILGKKAPSYGSLKMTTKTHSLDITIRNATGVKEEVQVIRYVAGLEIGISVN